VLVGSIVNDDGCSDGRNNANSITGDSSRNFCPDFVADNLAMSEFSTFPFVYPKNYRGLEPFIIIRPILTIHYSICEESIYI